MTQALETMILGKNTSYFIGHSLYKINGYPVDPCRPAENISHRDIQRHIVDKLNEWEKEKKDKDPKYRRWIYNMPTEAQWEYAARAGVVKDGKLTEQQLGAYCFGNDVTELPTYAWFRGNSPYFFDNLERGTQRVGRKEPNLFKLYDMHGNVWEPTRDAYQPELPGRDTKLGRIVWGVTDPHVPGEEGCDRVLRGGSWGFVGAYCRSAFRGYGWPVNAFGDRGVRLVRARE